MDSIKTFVFTYLVNIDVWLNIWANFLAIFIGVVFIILFKRRNLIKFFGLDKQKKLSILLSTLYIQPNTALTHGGSAISFQGLAIPEYEHQVIPFFSKLFSLITTGDNLVNSVLNKILLGDVDIDYLNTPMDYSSLSFHNFICIGGPAANSVTDYYLKSNVTWLGFSANNSGIEIKKGDDKGKVLGVSGKTDDYGMLEKIHDDNSHSVVFIAAGGNYGATKAAAFYLANNWASLHKRYKNGSFAICLKVPQYFIDKDGYKNPVIIYERKT